MKNSHKSFLFWVSFFVLGLIFLQYYKYQQSTEVKDFNYPKFLQALESKQVVKDSVVFNLSSKQIRGKLNEKGNEAFGGSRFVIEGNVEDKGIS